MKAGFTASKKSLEESLELKYLSLACVKAYMQ